MTTATINGVQLYWELTGRSGEPLVLVHGSWGDHHNWDLVAPGLAAAFRVLTFDRRGHSQSERLVGPGSVEEDASDLEGLIETLGLAPAHIIGNSFGGSIVLRLATRRPDLFRTLSVHEPPLFDLLADQPEAQGALSEIRGRITAVARLLETGAAMAGARQFVETIAFGPGTWDQLPAALRETFVFNAPTWLDEIRDPLSLHVDLRKLRGFARPAMLSGGSDSPPFFGAVLGKLAGALPRATRATIAGAGHVPHVSHPNHYVRLVTEFASTVPA
jgi:pimeloyl-ACP methyl ester carboxylesterase